MCRYLFLLLGFDYGRVHVLVRVFFKSQLPLEIPQNTLRLIHLQTERSEGKSQKVERSKS